MHTPVLLKEVVKYLDPKPGDQIIDATLDGGGHTLAIAEKIVPSGKILGIELDPVLFKEIESRIKNHELGEDIIIVNDSYTNIENIVREHNFRPNGILFDLGLSSWHYERSGRGFSFRKDEFLDMRYNPSSGLEQAAAEIINTYSKKELEKIFREYGEEQFSKSIAENTVIARKKKPITTTGELVEVISNSVQAWYKKKKIHFATKTFQALRIAVNHELENVEKGVRAAIDILEPGGRLAVISFQGLEDKIVKNIFRERVKEGTIKFVIKGTVRPKWEEIKNNPRARSAKMKVIEKL